MSGEIQRKERSINSIGEDVPKFIVPHKALYATSPRWDTRFYQAPFVFDEDDMFVLGRQPYRPVPFPILLNAIGLLAKLGAMEIKPTYLKERFDLDPLQDSLDNMNETYLLCNNIYMRFRKDHTSAGKDKAVHGFIMLGQEQTIINLANHLGLPHPFDDNLYPYKELFKDSREFPLFVLRSQR